MSQAADYSIAQLKLLRLASRRLAADNLLAQMNSAYAAFAAVMAKGGAKLFEKMQSELRKAAERE